MGALAIIDIQERDGHARQRCEVQRWPVSIGRGLDNDIVLDDPHVADHHLDLFEEDGQLRFSVGETRNGIRVDGRDYAAGGSGLWSGRHELHLGRTVLKLRMAHDPLPDEVPFLRAKPAAGAAVNFLLILGVCAILGFDSWLGFVGDTVLWRVMAPLLIGFVFVLVFWVGGWSLASKLFTKQMNIGRHLRTILLGVLLLAIADELVKMLAFVFNWPWFDRYAFLVNFIGIGAIVFAHLRITSTQWLPQLGVAVSVLTLAGISVYVLAQYGRIGHASDKHYMTALYPPALHLVKGLNTDDFITQAASLKGRLDARASDPAEEDRQYPE